MEKTCGNCEHFRQHYIKWTKEHFRQTNSGHCVRPRLKSRKNDSKACDIWQERTRTD